MRPPFYMDKLSPEDRATIKRWYLYGASTYSAIFLILVAMLAMRTEGVQSQVARITASSHAVAAERKGSPVCAARDLKLVTLIEQWGEARAVPGEKLAEAFFTMIKARDLCRSGRVAEALAIYDGIAIKTAQSAAR
jgi:hypothetical protein